MNIKTIILAAALQSVNGFGASPALATPVIAHNSNNLKAFNHIARIPRSGNTFQLQASSATEPSSNLELDTVAIAKYAAALVTQLSLISGFFYGVDSILATTGNSLLPTPATWLMIYAFSLKSRTFNPLNNARPNREKAVKEGKSDGFMDRNQPSWTPPGVTFPIMWLLIIGPLRATSATMVIESLGGYLSVPLMAFMLHLSCGDIWNTINNTEKRYGTAVVGIATVFATAVHAAWQYSQVDDLAGNLLGATTIWLAIAGTLIFEIWRLNPDEFGDKASLLPTKVVGEDSVTTFSWGAKKED